MRGKAWTAEEIAVLELHYPNRILEHLLPWRSWRAMEGKVGELRLSRRCRRWTSEEDDYLRATVRTLSHRAVGHALGRSVLSVGHRCIRLGIAKAMMPRKPHSKLNDDIRAVLPSLGLTVRGAGRLMGSASVLRIAKDNPRYGGPIHARLAIKLGGELFVDWNDR